MPVEFRKAIEVLRRAAEDYHNLMKLADTVAEKLAESIDGEKIVGRVSMLEVIGGDSIPVDVPPHVWVKLSHRWPQLLSPGYYTALVDPKTLTLMVTVVEEAQTRSALASIGGGGHGVPPLIGTSAGETAVQAPGYHMVSLRLVLKPVMAIHMGLEGATSIVKAEDPLKVLEKLPLTTPTIPPDPDSPVFIPKPSLLQLAVEAERGDGVDAAALAVLDKLYRVRSDIVAIRLPWRTLVKHVLVTGTTGSGKTSFVKNLVYNAARTGKARILILDANGDYVASAFPGYVPEELLDSDKRLIARKIYGIDVGDKGPLTGPHLNPVIVVPFYKWGSLDSQCRRYEARIRNLVSAMYSRLKCQASIGYDVAIEDRVCIYTVSLRDCIVEGEYQIPVAFRSILVGGDMGKLAQIDPLLTERAREEIRRIPSICKSIDKGFSPRRVEDVYECVAANREALQRRGFHRETINHILRRLYTIASIGFIDTNAPDLDYGELIALTENLGRHMGITLDSIIVDIEYAVTASPREADPKAVRLLLVAKTIQTLIKSLEERVDDKYTIVVIDEAHLFFGSKTEEYTASMISWIERLARLGRARGISIIFSTHREEDVSPTIQTLCNTKIYFRLDERTAEKTPIPAQYRRRLPYFADHAAILSSYAIRGGYTTIVSIPAIIGHRTA